MDVQPNRTELNNSTELPSAWTLFKSSMDLLGNRFGKLVAIWLSLFALQVLFSLPTRFLESQSSAGIDLPAILIIAVAYLLFLLPQILLHISFIFVLSDQSAGQNIGDIIKKSFSRFFPYIVTTLLFSLVVGVGILLFIVPGIIFSVWFALSAYIVVLEQSGPIEAMKRSKNYVSGNWGSVFAKGIFLSLIGIVITTPILLISSLIPVEAVPAIAENLTTSFLTLVSLSYFYLLYKKLRALKVGS